MFPNMDERAKFAELCGRFDSKNIEGAVVTLKEAAFMKLFCDAYFMHQMKKRPARNSPDRAETQPQDGQLPNDSASMAS
jgi:hypothetical protein